MAPAAATAPADSVKPRDVCIVGVARTPMGGFLGSLSPLPATKLGSIAIGTTPSISLGPTHYHPCLAPLVLKIIPSLSLFASICAAGDSAACHRSCTSTRMGLLLRDCKVV
ncbi:unnamed protein product [Camellia sinensis]